MSIQVMQTLNAFCGAAAGASFYILISSREYLLGRTYDPRYNMVYLIRFFTGLVAGIILASALGPILTPKFGDGAQFALTPGILAILGGFSADAVQLILQRLVDVLVTVVRGSPNP